MKKQNLLKQLRQFDIDSQEIKLNHLYGGAEKGADTEHDTPYDDGDSTTSIFVCDHDDDMPTTIVAL